MRRIPANGNAFFARATTRRTLSLAAPSGRRLCSSENPDTRSKALCKRRTAASVRTRVSSVWMRSRRTVTSSSCGWQETTVGSGRLSQLVVVERGILSVPFWEGGTPHLQVKPSGGLRYERSSSRSGTSANRRETGLQCQCEHARKASTCQGGVGPLVGFSRPRTPRL